MSQEEKSDRFSEEESKLVNLLLRFGERDPDRWLDTIKIAEEIFPSQKKKIEKAERLLGRVKKKLGDLGIEISQIKSRQLERKVYALPDNRLDLRERLQPYVGSAKSEATFVYLGELGFGTKAFDPKAIKGLSYFLKNNTVSNSGEKTLYDSLDAVVLNGNILPAVPLWYTVVAAQMMRLLDKRVPGKEYDEEKAGEDMRNAIQNADIKPELKDFYLKHVCGKIITKADAAANARQHLEDLFGDDFKGDVHYVYGENDEFMLKQLEELKVIELTRKAKESEDDLKKARKNLEQYEKTKGAYDADRNILHELTVWLTRAQRYSSKAGAFRQNTDDFIEKNRDKIREADKVSKRLGLNLEEMLKGAGSLADIKERMKDIESTKKIVSDDLAKTEAEIRGLNERILSCERVKEASGFFHVTKRVDLRPDHSELVRKEAAEEYADILKTCYPGIILHPERRADLFIEGHHLRVEHSANWRGNNPEKDSIARMRKQIQQGNRRGTLVPDVYLTAHGAEGMRILPMPKYKEEIAPGKYRETPEMCLLIKQPAFHSAKKLEYLFRNNQTKTWEVKRFEDNYASGALIHTITADKRSVARFIPMDDLIELGMLAEQCEQKKTSKEQVKKLFGIGETIELLLGTDYHVGAPTPPGRPSQYDYIKATSAFLEARKELPDVFLMTEILHGDLEHAFKSGKQYLKPLHHQVVKTIDKIKSDPSLSDKQRIDLLAALNLLQDEEVPIPNIDDQYAVSDHYVHPIAKKVLANNGLVVIASGNHVNDSARGKLDEASGLQRAFSKEEQERVIALKRKESNFGLGEFTLELLNDGRKLYFAHRMLKGSDNVVGMMNQVRGMNFSGSAVYMGDVHHPEFGFADGTAFVIGPGKQAWNTYVDSIGMQASLRGEVLHRLSRNPRLLNYHEVEFVLDEAIEPYLDKGKIDSERLLIERYLPKNGF